MRKFYFGLAVLWVFLAKPNLNAQFYNFHHYTIDDGLVGSNVYAVTQDSLGYIWFATDNGICRFDGIDFKTYESPILQGQEILTVQYLDHTIWFTDLKGRIFYIENEEIQHFDPLELRDNGSNKEVVQVDKDEFLIACGNGQVNVYKRKNASVPYKQLQLDTTFLIPHIQKNHYGRIVMKSNQNGLVEGAVFNHVFRYSSVNSTFENDSYALPPNINVLHFSTIYGFVGDIPNHPDWIKLFCEEQKDLIELLPHKLLRHSKKNQEYLLNINGAYIREKGGVFQKLKGLDVGVNNVFEDREGNLWFCTRGHGIYLLANETFLLYNSRVSSLPFDHVYDIEGNEHAMYVAGESGWISEFREDDIHSIRLDSKNEEFYDMTINNDEIFASYDKGYLIAIDSSKKMKVKQTLKAYAKAAMCLNGYYWFVCSNGVHRISKDIRHNFSATRNYAIHPDHSGTKIWLGGVSGLSYLTDISFSNHAKEVQKSNGGYDPLKMAYKYEQWLSPSPTISHYKYNSPPIKKYFSKNNKSLDYQVTDIESKLDASLWISTRGGGVFILQNDSLRQITKEQGLNSNIAANIYIDKEEQVWVATSNGVNLIKKDGTILSITTDDGLVSNDVTSVYKKDSIIYVGTTKGLCLINERKIVGHKNAPNVFFRSIGVNEKEIPLAKQVELSHEENNLFIDFIGISYQGKIKYKYKLVGLQQDWVETTENNIRLTSLSPNNYTLLVKAIRQNGMESKQVATIKIIIHPPFWKTAWFRALTIFLLLGLLLGGMRLWIQKIRDEEAKKTATQKKFAELELQALQAQMNPHFVFNSLNAIQNYILGQEVKMANKYLSKFALLMRLFLESSYNKYTTVNEEKKLLSSYIDMEKLRFKDKFDVDFKVNLPDNFEIPSMLLQPFVENAINHGLVNKKGKGLLSVSMKYESGNIVCIIDDDGIGREKTKEIKAKSFKPYKSRGMKIIEERMKIMKDVGGSNIHIRITDKKDEAGTGIGTKVVITIPTN